MAKTGRLRQLEFGILRPEEPASERNQELVEALADLLLQAAASDVPVQEGSDESKDLG
jgi:hypothetical protein